MKHRETVAHNSMSKPDTTDHQHQGGEQYYSLTNTVHFLCSYTPGLQPHPIHTNTGLGRRQEYVEYLTPGVRTTTYS